MNPQQFYITNPYSGGQVFLLWPIFAELEDHESRIKHFSRAIQAFDHPSAIDSSTLNWFWPASTPADNLQFDLSTVRQRLNLEPGRFGKFDEPRCDFNVLKHKLRIVVGGLSYPFGNLLVITQLSYFNTPQVLKHKRLLLVLLIVGFVCVIQRNKHIRAIGVEVGGKAVQIAEHQPL